MENVTTINNYTDKKRTIVPLQIRSLTGDILPLNINNNSEYEHISRGPFVRISQSEKHSYIYALIFFNKEIPVAKDSFICTIRTMEDSESEGVIINIKPKKELKINSKKAFFENQQLLSFVFDAKDYLEDYHLIAAEVYVNFNSSYNKQNDIVTLENKKGSISIQA